MFRLALKNILAGGLRTWLNVLVLSLAYIGIIGMQGIGESMRRNMFEAVIAEEIGGGHIRHKNYDPYEPYLSEESFEVLPPEFIDMIEEERATPLLIVSGTAYPQGRMQAVTLRGIDPAQTILQLPTEALKSSFDQTPVLIGKRMQRMSRLSEGDTFMVRFRDKRGVFSARQLIVAGIGSFDSQSLDAGQLWLPINDLQDMMGAEQAATIMVLSDDKKIDSMKPATDEAWVFKSQDELTADL